MPKRGVVRFGKRWKLSPRFIGPFEILERVGTVAYQLALPPNKSSVHEVFTSPCSENILQIQLMWWIGGQIEVDTDGTFEEGPVCILDICD